MAIEARVIIASSNIQIFKEIREAFAPNGVIFYEVQEGYQLFEMAKKLMPELIIIHIKLSDMDGTEACFELRNTYGIKSPFVLFYSEEKAEFIQVEAYKAGADDYFFRPASPRLINYKLSAILGRLTKKNEVKTDTNVGDLKIDREKYLLFKRGERIILPRKEFELLALLSSKPKKVFTRQEIQEKVWGYEMDLKNRTIDVHIRKLREKLGDEYIVTVKGIGYKLEMGS
jgi:two-component system, OmpR family, alkaline phosphatase synthesis response regulator PhoP